VWVHVWIPTGATALDKKSRKEYENRKLAEIGAKPEKGPRIAAVIGKGMVRSSAVPPLSPSDAEMAEYAGHIFSAAIAMSC
jgi:hypothetical protein